MADASGSVTKHKQGKPLKSGEKLILLNVFNKLCEKYPETPIKEITALTSEFTGVSTFSITSARKEMKETGVLVTPGKKRKRAKPVMDTCDSFTKSAIRSKVHNFFFRNEAPTLQKILTAVNDDSGLPSFKRTTLYKILQEIGFVFVKRNRQSILIDRDDITVWRREYIRTVRKFRNEGRKFYYLDETWVNEGHVTNKVWVDSTVKNKKQAFLSGLSTGVKNPTGKGKRLIVLHIGSDDGFVDGGLLLFESKKTGDYHEEMNGDTFKTWFENVLPKLNPNSVIVMDNAPYHSVKLERIPTLSWRKQDIISWLKEKTISFDVNSVKAELIQLVKSAQVTQKYVIDNIAKRAGHTIVRLPPYHCNFNPIELVWSQVKGFVASNNTTFKIRDIRPLVETSVTHVTAEKWKNCIAHAIKEEDRMWNLDGISDEIVDNFVIHIGGNESNSDLSGIESLPDDSDQLQSDSD